MKVVICGGGVIGCSIAYYLAKKGVRSVLVERCDLACAASGKAGGFLAKDWCDSYELGPLARKSFDLHEQLAEEFENTDYRKLDTLSVTAKEGSRGKLEAVPEWLDGDVVGAHSIGTTATTAQVHPYKLTHAYFKHAELLVGTSLYKGVVEDIEFADSKKSKVAGVKVSGQILEADVVVIAMGPWSGQASDWLKVPRIVGNRAHSILIVPKEPMSPHALFTDVTSKNGGSSRDPEFYPRPDGDVYICGMCDKKSLPVDPGQVEFNEQSCQTLKKDAEMISSKFTDADIKLSQACYLPNPPDGLPVIGKVPGTEGAFIATGHTCWGILNSPGTGAAMAELIVDGKSTIVDLSPFDPSRFY